MHAQAADFKVPQPLAKYSGHTVLWGGCGYGLVGLMAGADQPEVDGVLLRLQ